MKTAPSGRRPKTEPDDLGCESACTGCQKLHAPSPFIITQLESWYSFYRPTDGRRLSRLMSVETWCSEQIHRTVTSDATNVWCNVVWGTFLFLVIEHTWTSRETYHHHICLLRVVMCNWTIIYCESEKNLTIFHLSITLANVVWF